MRQIRIIYADGTCEYIGLKEAAFGTEGTVLHGPVKSATVGEWLDEQDGSFPSHNRVSRSMTREIPPTMRSGMPIYGTGTDR